VDRLVPSRESSGIPLRPTVERKARRTFFLVPCQILTEESSRAHFPDIGSAALWVDTFEVLERSSDQI
jgi:hypothetical protein